ncbi:hypothetical protein F2Q69_00008767 [Brassica cretica]|uniref:Uncharacterized protein n=1 Tax=Brassica cretica TaxID=69181 RepID=A0A8S9NXQ7_BRACR|nr:hypothetical protein F2Q69_00008767 [Brassica cretica]
MMTTLIDKIRSQRIANQTVANRLDQAERELAEHRAANIRERNQTPLDPLRARSNPQHRTVRYSRDPKRSIWTLHERKFTTTPAAGHLDEIDTGIQRPRSTPIQFQNGSTERQGVPRTRIPPPNHSIPENRNPSATRTFHQAGFDNLTEQARRHDLRGPGLECATELLEVFRDISGAKRPPRVPLPARAKKAGRRKLTRVDQRGLDDPGRSSAGRPARVGRPAQTTQDDPAQKEPNFQYNNYQQKPFYNNQQGGYQARQNYSQGFSSKGNQSTQGQAGSSTSAPQESSTYAMLKHILESHTRSEKHIGYELKNLHTKVDGSNNDLNNKLPQQ